MLNDYYDREWRLADDCAYRICDAVEDMVHREVFGDALRWRYR